MSFSDRDLYWMQRAISLAKQAKEKGEVPVGAILIQDDKVIGEGFNQPIRGNDPTAHAEIVALRQAALYINNYRLINTTLYVTLEPCLMCAGAMVHARVKRLVFGASDPRAGAVVSQASMLAQSFLNHTVDYAGGLLAEVCGGILSDFFRLKRKK